MKQELIDAIGKEAVDRWGTVAQSHMAIEEMGELIVALIQDKRNRVTLEDLITEVADVTIMMNQMAYILGRDKVEAEIERKINRLQGRLQTNTQT